MADANGILLTFTKLTLIVIIIIVAWSSILLPMYFGNANLITSVAAQQNSEEEEDLFFRGSNAYQQARYEEAIEYFDRVLAIDPNHVGALLSKGLALDRLGR